MNGSAGLTEDREPARRRCTLIAGAGPAQAGLFSAYSAIFRFDI
ncbi:hypothetical protein FHR72_003137 [Mycolicibacterium iranicum]|uniref:Uncharacterized protein n=1 Tax=Mycolicibacterium iranicum TaxID=912594 RepID=A0A839QEH3_MYCIR|nr:hypothetical protein [Mycolicibacterium iranicum]